MRSRLGRMISYALCVAAIISVFCIGASAYTYSSNLPGNVSSLKVTVGGTAMPLSRYPDGAYYDPEKCYMTVAEQKAYGISAGSDIYLRGWECVSFARYVYAALFYKYPQDATMDNYLAYSSGPSSIYYRNVIKDTFGTNTLSAGYTAANLKKLISNCQPGAVMRVSGHSMVIMGIFNDGFVIYDANFSSSNEVDVRSYTWQGFINSLGGRSIEAVQNPAYHPGYTYTYDNKIQGGGSEVYGVDTSTAGTYEVYNCSTLNVRSAPTTAASSVGSITSGTKLAVKGTHDGWALIDYNGVERWVNFSYLKAASAELTVTFDAAGGTATETTHSYQVGSLFATLPTATKTDCTFLGWYYGNTQYTAGSTVPAGTTLKLTAHWGVMGFTDVLDTMWYASYVAKGVKYGLIMQDTKFNPNTDATRAQFVTVLAREYQRETGKDYDTGSLGSSVFRDLVPNAYYDKAIAWAYQNQITSGISEGVFGPNQSVKREQIATFLYRYAKAIGMIQGEYSGKTLIYNYNDGAKVSKYAATAMSWAIDAGLIQGDTHGNLNPQKSARRSEMVTIMTRFIDYLTANYSGEYLEMPAVADNADAQPEEAAAAEDSAAAPDAAVSDETPAEGAEAPAADADDDAPVETAVPSEEATEAPEAPLDE